LIEIRSFYWQLNKETSSLAFTFGLGPDLSVMGSDNMTGDIDANSPAKPVNLLSLFSPGKGLFE